MRKERRKIGKIMSVKRKLSWDPQRLPKARDPHDVLHNQERIKTA